MWAYGMGNGNALVLSFEQVQVATRDAPDPDLLATAPAELASWVGEAVAAGVTFEVLRRVAVEAVRRGLTRQGQPANASQVTATITAYLLSCGYIDPQVSEIRLVEAQGWTARGSVDRGSFTARSDTSGNVVHVRVR